MPTKRAMKRATKNRTTSVNSAAPGQFNVHKTAAKARRAEREARQIRDLSDLSTLRHPRRSHEANFELFDARQALVKSSGGKWTYKEAGNILLMQKLVQKGKFSDFPGLRQRDGVAVIQGLMEWNQLLNSEQRGEQLSE